MRQNNFWWDYEKAKPKHVGIQAVINGIVLIHLPTLWKNIPKKGSLAEYIDEKKTPWLVYEASDTRQFGEWQVHKTQPKAVEDFIQRCLSRPNTPHAFHCDNKQVVKAITLKGQMVRLPEYLKNTLNIQDWEDQQSNASRESAVVVEFDGQEVEHFYDEKAAGAWILHVYHMIPQQAREKGIIIKSTTERAPSPGDAVFYDGNGKFHTLNGDGTNGGYGILEMFAGSLAICFSPSTFRIGDTVSCSGGPLPWIEPNSLVYSGLHRASFWRWHRGQVGGGEGGHYHMTVPLWKWNGQTL